MLSVALWIFTVNVVYASWVISDVSLPLGGWSKAVGQYNETIYLIASGSPTYQFGEFAKYNIAQNNFTNEDNFQFNINIISNSHHYTQINNTIYMISSDDYLSIYNMKTNTYIPNWQLDMFISRKACITSSNNQLFIIQLSGSGYHLIRMNLLSMKWIHDNPSPQEQRLDCGCLVDHDRQKLYVIGGYSETRKMITETNEILEINGDIAQNQWQYIDNLTIPLRGIRPVLFKNIIFAIGGYDQIYENDTFVGNYAVDYVHIINPTTGNVFLSSEKLPYPIIDTSPIVVNDIIYAFSGQKYIGPKSWQITTDWMYYYEPTTTPTYTSISPSQNPTEYPSIYPTNSPTNTTIYPTLQPTDAPSYLTINPTMIPTFNPSLLPTFYPTFHPTTNPTFNPSLYPTSHPTFIPTIDPTNNPSNNPTINPSIGPTINPSIDPTINPSLLPSFNPTVFPTMNPIASPTETAEYCGKLKIIIINLFGVSSTDFIENNDLRTFITNVTEYALLIAYQNYGVHTDSFQVRFTGVNGNINIFQEFCTFNHITLQFLSDIIGDENQEISVYITNKLKDYFKHNKHITTDDLKVQIEMSSFVTTDIEYTKDNKPIQLSFVSQNFEAILIIICLSILVFVCLPVTVMIFKYRKYRMRHNDKEGEIQTIEMNERRTNVEGVNETGDIDQLIDEVRDEELPLNDVNVGDGDMDVVNCINQTNL